MEKGRIIQIMMAVFVVLTILISVASVISNGKATVDRKSVIEKEINEKSPGKIQVRPTTLTYPLYRARAVWDGRYIYILGGTAIDKSGSFNESASNIIQRYDPRADTIEIVLADSFPYARWYTTAVYISSREATYIFGGHGKSGQGGQILKYNHTTNNVTVIGNNSDLGEFGNGAYGMTAIKISNESILIFGGVDYLENFTWAKYDDIWLFNTSTENLTRLSIKMPCWQNTALGVYDFNTDSVYLMGGAGTDTGVDPIAKVTRLSRASYPVASEMKYFDSLPAPYDNLEGFWSKGYIYSYGGDKGGNLTDEINVYSPSKKKLYTLPERLPSPRDRVAVAYDGNRAYIFGGSTTSGPSNQIIWHDRR
ncbi:Kelch motif protein [uncultured archaeon]|nr:Kelch motif protein [uncultured archaeon]